MGEKTQPNTVDINFARQEIPQLIELKSYDHQFYLSGRDNRWFQELLELYYNSSIHAACINNLNLKIRNLSNSGITTDDVYNQCMLDYLIMGNFAIETIWNLDHTAILKYKHLDVSKVRAGMIDDQTGEVSTYLFSNDWFKYNNRCIDKLSAFSTAKNSDIHQIYYGKRYSPQSDIYGKPYYYSAIRWIYTDVQLERYYSSLIKNNFVGNIILSVNSYMDQEKQVEFERAIKRHFTGADNAGGIMVVYSESKDNAPTIEAFNKTEQDTAYQWLTEQVIQQISLGHQVPSQIIGIWVAGKLGASTEIPSFDKIYTDTVVIPLKNEFDRLYNIVKNKYLPL